MSETCWKLQKTKEEYIISNYNTYHNVSDRWLCTTHVWIIRTLRTIFLFHTLLQSQHHSTHLSKNVFWDPAQPSTHRHSVYLTFKHDDGKLDFPLSWKLSCSHELKVPCKPILLLRVLQNSSPQHPKRSATERHLLANCNQRQNFG